MSSQTVQVQNYQSTLIQSFQLLQKEINELIDVKTFESKAATQAAKGLHQDACKFRDHLFEPNHTAETFEKELKEKEIFFPITYRMVQILRQPEIQCYDSLKEELSKTTRIFFELVVFQFHLQERRIYTDTVERIRSTFRKVIETLPKEEVVTRFELKCAKSAAKKLDFGIGKWKQLGKDQSSELAEGLITTLASLSPNPPYVSPGPIISCAYKLSFAVYKTLEDSWYKDIWTLSWFSVEKKMQNLDGFKSLNSYMKEYKNNYKLTIYLSNLFMNIIRSDVDDSLKKEVFNGEISLITFANYRPYLRTKKFWEVRYCTLLHLKTLVQKNFQLDDCIKSVLKCCVERREEEVVKRLAKAICVELSPKIQNQWINMNKEILKDAENEKLDLLKKQVKPIKISTPQEQNIAGISNQPVVSTQPSLEEIEQNIDKQLEQLKKQKIENQPSKTMGSQEQNIAGMSSQSTLALGRIEQKIGQLAEAKEQIHDMHYRLEILPKLEQALKEKKWELLESIN